MIERNERVPTGVPGLDDILHGGLLRHGFYLIQGDPGSGKTTLALRFVREQLQRGERCLYITLTETRRDLETAAAAHGWSLDGIDVCDLTRAAAGESDASVFHPADTELGDTTRAVTEAIARTRPHHVVFDGLSELRLLSGDPLVYRRQLLALKEQFAQRRCTAVMLDDRSSPFELVAPESLVGGNLILERLLPVYGKARRRLVVTKVRGSRFREGFHDYEIVEGGVMVFPRLVASEHHQAFPRTVQSSGLASLDVMLGGGVTRGSTTLMLGPAGVGKSTIAMQFCVHALRSGQRGAVFLFDEVLSTLMERAEKLCLGVEGGIQHFVDEGLLHAQQVDPAELTPGEFADRVRRQVDAGTEVVVIDSLNGYLNAMPEERFLTAHLHELFSYLNQKGVITLFVVAQHGMVAPSGMLGDLDVSYLADTVLLFRYFEASGEILQALSVFKKRTGAHERSLRQLRISAQGVEIGEPLRGFHGIMTGVPQFDADLASLLLAPAQREG